MKIPIFPGKYHQNGGFSMAILVVSLQEGTLPESDIAPEPLGLEDYVFLFLGWPIFRCELLVSGGGSPLDP